MADRFVSVELENEGELDAKIVAYGERKRRQLRDMVDDIGQFAHSRMAAIVPVRNYYLFRHVDWTGVHSTVTTDVADFVATVGVKAGESKHPLYVNFGTGIYGAVGWYVTPQVRKYMAWTDKTGMRWFAKKTRGQRPQHFLYATWTYTQVYAWARIFSEPLID